MQRVNYLLAALVVSVISLAEAAERAYPSKPIRLIVPYAPGGGNDTMARAIGGKLTAAWGQQVIIDNRPGANGLLAGEIAARAAPDGYTLFMANIASHAINPALYKKIPYDAVKDFAPVSLLGTTANVLVVHPSTPVKSLQELINLAKAKPGQLTYGSNGTGSSQHLAGALFGSTFGLSLVHVPYKGTGPMMNDMLGGQISMSFANMVAALPQVQSKRLVPIAVTSLKRASALPDVPPVAETAPGFEATSWWGVVATGGTPPGVVDALNREIVKGLGAPDMKAFFARVGAEPRGMTPQEFAAFIRSELAKWGKVVRESGARAD
ncbi:MAG: LacI family transcriptional regulator [Betaproteobacteria bacterium RIFCSPLOWO2_12_FULL_62_58]|nr:MAG: LacI family transcriptional regulator [Betaproteobacteria bacterium RIFCSPLOWO2_02_FULL_62_79]OGA47313.1 MAG: LacI family transcriptional regulator [Betaproteobacteria bacterium RIFCSPLOWO2_12_FULL_62_58]